MTHFKLNENQLSAIANTLTEVAKQSLCILDLLKKLPVVEDKISADPLIPPKTPTPSMNHESHMV